MLTKIILPSDCYCQVQDIVYCFIKWYLKEPGSNVWTRSSIKTDTYSVKMIPSKNGRQVKCVVADKFGVKAETNVVTLNMNVPEGYRGPVVIPQPQECTVAKGCQSTLTVVAQGYGLKYKWYGTNPDGTDFVSSLRGDAYYDDMISEKSGKRVYCVITDIFGFSVQSETATLYTEDNLNHTV